MLPNLMIDSIISEILETEYVICNNSEYFLPVLAYFEFERIGNSDYWITNKFSNFINLFEGKLYCFDNGVFVPDLCEVKMARLIELYNAQ
jgi:hypothetical protein